MAQFRYKTRTNEGKVLGGLVEAPNTQTAVKLLRNRNLFIIHLSEVATSGSLNTLLGKLKKSGFNEVVNFTRQLATMIVAGLALPDALTILRGQIKDQVFRSTLLDVEHQIVGGGNLADALSRYPQYFSTIYIALVRAGESSGTLDKVMKRLAESLENQREFRSKVIGALIYPVIIVIGMVVVMFIMMTVVVPKLTELYSDFGVSLPWSTQLLMGISGFFVMFWWLVIILVVFGLVALERWYKTPPGELMIDSLIFKIPLFGELQKKIILVEFTRTLSMLIASGIHILDGLKVLRPALGNVLFRNALDDVSDRVEKGFSIGQTFAQQEIFPPIVPQMIRVGEETGKLDETLLKVSEYFQTESEHLVKGLTTAIEPIIMVFLGLGVGFIVFSVITPIYTLTTQFK